MTQCTYGYILIYAQRLYLCLAFIANKVKIASLGGIEAIIKAMSTHKDNSGVQEYACAALRNLAANNDGIYIFAFRLCRRLDVFFSSLFLLCCFSEA